jgi:uncharacterized membrane protein YdbT with pleckstrin-like domain
MARNSFLNDDEQIVMTKRPHIKALLPVTLALLVAVIGGTFAALLLNPAKKFGSLSSDALLTYVVLGVIAFAALNWFRRWLVWRKDELLLTTHRLISRSGVVSKSLIEIPLERINNISCTQSAFERIFKSGDLIVESGGEDGKQVFSDLSGPADVQREVYRQMERNQARDMDRMAGKRQLTVPEQLEKLDELRQRGVVSQAEFDAKKAQLLAQM